MAKTPNQAKSTEFHVVLNGLNLSQDIQKQIETEIREVVMKQLATIDLKGDLLISPLGVAARVGGGGQTQGIQVTAR